MIDVFSVPAAGIRLTLTLNNAYHKKKSVMLIKDEKGWTCRYILYNVGVGSNLHLY